MSSSWEKGLIGAVCDSRKLNKQTSEIELGLVCDDEVCLGLSASRLPVLCVLGLAVHSAAFRAREVRKRPQRVATKIFEVPAAS